MKKLYMKFNNGSELEADIIENDFTEAFYELFQEQKKCGKKLADTKVGYWRQSPLTYDKENWPAEKILASKQELVDNINEAIANLKTEFGLEYPKPHAFVEMQQPECNLIHRCFTTSEMRYTGNGRGSGEILNSVMWEFPLGHKHEHLAAAKENDREWFCDLFAPKGNLTEVPLQGPVERFKELIHIINRDIHNFESYTETSNKHKIRDIISEEESWHITQRFDVRADNGCGMILPDDQNSFEQEWRRYCSFENHDIWLLKDILGKDYHQCWLDEDDPTNVDICNIDLRHAACLCVDQNNGLNKFLNHSEFKSWLNGYGLEHKKETTANIPIADISNGWNMNDYLDDIRGHDRERIKTIDWDMGY